MRWRIWSGRVARDIVAKSMGCVTVVVFATGRIGEDYEGCAGFGDCSCFFDREIEMVKL
jgi:hypothetical protein